VFSLWSVAARFARQREDNERTSWYCEQVVDVPGLVSPARPIRTGVMSRTVKLSVKARGETDSPRVDDFLDQVRDYFEILDGVEQALADDGSNAIEWRIVSATTNSPIELEARPYPLNFAVNIDQRAERVIREAAFGMNQLRSRRERPTFFTDKVLARAEKLFERVMNGLETTVVDFGADLPKLEITASVAREAAANTRSILRPPERSYREQGSIEGTARTIDRDGRGHLILWIRNGLTGEDIKCLVTGDAEAEIGDHQIRDVWRNRRVQVYGLLHYKGPGRISQIDAIKVRFLRERSDLPGVDDIVDRNFTGGLLSEDYLADLRDGERS
jgi:hypothetical protein